MQSSPASDLLQWVVGLQQQRRRRLLALLGPVSPTQVNSNHQLAYFANHSDTTHVRHQPTAVA